MEGQSLVVAASGITHMSSPFDFAARSRRMPASGVRKVFDAVQAHEGVADMTLGEPDFATPAPIVDAVTAALGEGATGYTQTVGRQDLRVALADKLDAENDVAVDPDEELIVTPGAMGALFAATHVLCESGDEVLIPAPYWTNYRGHVADTGGTLVPVPTDPSTGFVPRAEDVAAAASADTVGLVLNTPGNPTGAVVSPEQLRAIGEVLIDRDLWAIVDETYEDLVYDDAVHHSLASDPALFERIVTIHSFSKSYAMTGWRIGYASAPADVVSAMRALQEHTVSCVSEPSQVAAVAALDYPEVVADIHGTFADRRAYVLDRLDAIDGIDPGRPRGAFYVFADISALTADSGSFVDYLLEEAGVGAIPGSVFGSAGEGFLRFSYATDRATITEAMDRLERAVAEHA